MFMFESLIGSSISSLKNMFFKTLVISKCRPKGRQLLTLETCRLRLERSATLPALCIHARSQLHLSGQEPKHLIDTIVVLNARMVQFALQRAQVLV